jgi:hypothetical protein
MSVITIVVVSILFVAFFVLGFALGTFYVRDTRSKATKEWRADLQKELSDYQNEMLALQRQDKEFLQALNEELKKASYNAHFLAAKSPDRNFYN